MRFLMVVIIVLMSIAFLTLDVITPRAQAANPPTCVSAIPPPVQGTPIATPITKGMLFINEILTNPNSPWNCADQKPSSKDAWIELYNSQAQPIDLNASHVEVDIGSLLPLQSSAVIPGNGFLVLFLFANTTTTISSVQLTVPGTVIDSVTLPTTPLLPDQSYARIPDGNPNNIQDGSQNWQVSNYPTIEASNRLIAPTPTATPTKVHTPTARKAKIGHSSNQDQTITSNASNSVNVPSTNDGAQPSWRTLQIPDETMTPTIRTTAAQPSSQSPQPEASSDLPKKIIISLSVVVLVFALLWCGKLFFSP